MKKVLFIAYHFPPIASGGTFRSLKFVKYLPQFGWQPTVITTNSQQCWAYDDNLLKEIPQQVKILRARQFEWLYVHALCAKLKIPGLYDWIKDKYLVPDNKIGWINPALKAAKKELKTNHYDLIFSTSPTISAHIIAMRLAQQFDIKWVADFRDFWTLHPNYATKNSKRRLKEKTLEQTILNQANGITAAFQKIVTTFQTEYPSIDPEKFSVIYNGFNNPSHTPNQPKNNKLNILYTGSFYGAYNPTVLFNALKTLYREKPVLKKVIEFTFVGNIEEKIKQTDLPNVHFYSFKSGKELRRLKNNADLFLLILPAETQLPAKIFDYMAEKKPIFAIIPDSETKTMLDQSKLGIFANPDAPQEIQEQLLSIYENWKNNQLRINPNRKFINQFHRKTLTKQLATTFESIS